MKNKHLIIRAIFITVIVFFNTVVSSQIQHIPFSVLQVKQLQVNLSKDTSVCQGATLVINPLISGGTLPFNFTWNTSCTGKSCAVTSAGTYSVSVTDSNNCTATGNIIVNINKVPVILKNIPNQTVCQGSSVSFTANASGNNLSYQWTKGGTNITGATNSNYYINSAKASDYDIYSCYISNICTIQLPSFILYVNTPPSSSTIFVKQIKNQNDSVSYTLSPGGTEPFTFQWMNNGKIIKGATSNTLNIKHIICSDSGIYTCSIGNKCDTIIAEVAQLYVQCIRFRHDISGYVKYDNHDSTVLTNTKVYLANAGDTIINSTTTDNTGNYVFLNLINGTYKLSCSITKAWGGVNPVDALLIDRTYIGLNRLTDPLKRKAADVNDDGKINPIDALLIDRRYVHLIHKFTIPDWLFTSPTINIDGLDINENIIALCAGDVNASYTPPARITLSQVHNTGTLNIIPNKPFDIPVYLSSEFGVQSSELGALGIKLRITNYELRIISIKSDLEGLIYNISGNEVNIAWVADNEGYSLTPDEPLFYIKAIYNGESSLSSFHPDLSGFQITSESVIADIDANLISTDKLVMPEIRIENGELRMENYPNPFNNITNIEYVLPEDLNVKLSVYNVLGEKVINLVNENQQTGQYIVKFNGSALKQGIYFCKIEATSITSAYSKTDIMMIAR